MKKILIKHNDIKFIGYLIEDLPTKFRALNEEQAKLYVAKVKTMAMKKVK